VGDGGGGKSRHLTVRKRQYSTHLQKAPGHHLLSDHVRRNSSAERSRATVACRHEAVDGTHCTAAECAMCLLLSAVSLRAQVRRSAGPQVRRYLPCPSLLHLHHCLTLPQGPLFIALLPSCSTGCSLAPARMLAIKTPRGMAERGVENLAARRHRSFIPSSHSCRMG
jgi:hypothetical protein